MKINESHDSVKPTIAVAYTDCITICCCWLLSLIRTHAYTHSRLYSLPWRHKHTHAHTSKNKIGNVLLVCLCIEMRKFDCDEIIGVWPLWRVFNCECILMFSTESFELDFIRISIRWPLYEIRQFQLTWLFHLQFYCSFHQINMATRKSVISSIYSTKHVV